jgi:hypothetical protein
MHFSSLRVDCSMVSYKPFYHWVQSPATQTRPKGSKQCTLQCLYHHHISNTPHPWPSYYLVLKAVVTCYSLGCHQCQGLWCQQCGDGLGFKVH